MIERVPYGERVPFEEITADFLSAYYSYCRSKFRRRELWSDGEHERAYAYDEFYTAYDLPLENLMLETIAIILGGGRSPKADEYHWEKIDKILSKDSFDDLVKNLPEDELYDFRSDFELIQSRRCG